MPPWLLMPRMCGPATPTRPRSIGTWAMLSASSTAFWIDSRRLFEVDNLTLPDAARLADAVAAILEAAVAQVEHQHAGLGAAHIEHRQYVVVDFTHSPSVSCRSCVRPALAAPSPTAGFTAFGDRLPSRTAIPHSGSPARRNAGPPFPGAGTVCRHSFNFAW